MIRTNDYKKYVAFKKTVDDLYPQLPVSAGGFGTGIFTQLAGLYSSVQRPEWLNNFITIDTEYCMRSGEKWLNKTGAIGLNYDPNTHEFGQTTFSDVKLISEMLLEKYGTKWDKLYSLYVEDYDPLKNWDATEDHNGDWTKNGTEDRDKDTTYSGSMDKSRTYGQGGHTTQFTYNNEANERTYDNYKETKNGGKQTYHESGWKETVDHKNTGYTETTTQITPSMSSDETLTAGFNTGTSASKPVTISTNTSGTPSISSVGNYNPEHIVVHNSTDGASTFGISGTKSDEYSDNGKKSYDEYAPNTYDGIEGKYKDTKSGGHTITENGTYTDSTSYTNRVDNEDGTTTYDLDGTKNESITYSGFFDRMGVNRSDLYVKEWDARMKTFLEEVFKDVDDLITLKIY